MRRECVVFTSLPPSRTFPATSCDLGDDHPNQQGSGHDGRGTATEPSANGSEGIRTSTCAPPHNSELSGDPYENVTDWSGTATGLAKLLDLQVETQPLPTHSHSY